MSAHGAALDCLARWPRRALADLPTPLLRTDRLAARMGVEHAYVKMDAETGFALGGNKVRKLEFVLEAGRLAGVTHILTAGGPQSNHCRVTAAAAARLGRACVLVLNGPEPARPTGNALLHRLFGAEIVTVDPASCRSRRTSVRSATASGCPPRRRAPAAPPSHASRGSCPTRPSRSRPRPA